ADNFEDGDGLMKQIHTSDLGVFHSHVSRAFQGFRKVSYGQSTALHAEVRSCRSADRHLGGCQGVECWTELHPLNRHLASERWCLGAGRDPSLCRHLSIEELKGEVL